MKVSTDKTSVSATSLTSRTMNMARIVVVGTACFIVFFVFLFKFNNTITVETHLELSGEFLGKVFAEKQYPFTYTVSNDDLLSKGQPFGFYGEGLLMERSDSVRRVLDSLRREKLFETAPLGAAQNLSEFPYLSSGLTNQLILIQASLLELAYLRQFKQSTYMDRLKILSEKKRIGDSRGTLFSESDKIAEGYIQALTDIFTRDSLLEEGGYRSTERLNKDQATLYAGILQKYSRRIESLRLEEELKENELKEVDLRAEFNDTEKTIVLQVANAVEAALSYLDDYREENTLRSPLSGRAVIPTFHKLITPAADQLLISVVGEGFSENHYRVYCKAPLKAEPYIKTGTKVNIRLAEYPHLDFGVVRGVVVGENKFYDEHNQFFIDVKLNNGLTTSRGYKITPKTSFRGKAEVLLFRKSVLGHLWDNLRYRTDRMIAF